MKKAIQLFLVFIIILALAGCSASGGQPAEAASSGTTNPAALSQPAADSGSTTGADQVTASAIIAANEQVAVRGDDSTFNPAEVVEIDFNGSTITVTGAGVTVDGSTATISAAGSYRLRGTLSSGQVIVDTKDDGAVRLIFDGATLQSDTSAPVYIKKAARVVVLLAEGSQNSVTDAAAYQYDDPQENEPNAAIFSNADLTITGSGSLAVTGRYNDGISSDDGLVISGGNIVVNAVDDGIRGKDYLVIVDGDINVEAQANGLKSDGGNDDNLGYIAVESGPVNVNAQGDAVQAATVVAITGGTFNLVSGGGTSAASWSTSSAKGIKAAQAVTIDGGTFTIDSADDGLHSNGSLVINGGAFTIASGDDGAHADATLEINNGEMNIVESYEGLESAIITLNGGYIHITASDDGINVAGGNDASGLEPMGMERPGRPRPGQGQDLFAFSGDTYLYIHGGYVAVDAGGDGLDVNGAVTMTGGVVLVQGPTEQMNGALDYDAGFQITGGMLVAVGSAGMAQAPDTSSSQPSLLANLNSVQPAGSLVSLTDSAGSAVLAFLPSKAYQSIVFSSPALEQGATYTLTTGGSSAGTAQDGLIQAATVSGGSQVASFQINGPLTQIGRMMGGPGGMRRP